MRAPVLLISFLLLLANHSVESGSPCPHLESILPCFCSNFDDGMTSVVCPGLHNTSVLEEATKPMKSMIVDRLVLLNTFTEDNEEGDLANVVDPKSKIPLNGVFPKKWLSELRVRYLEVQTANLNGYFLVDDALEGQSEFLTSIVVKNANLKGHLCSSCGPASNIVATSTSELRRVLLLKEVDFSFNQLEVVDGSAFPSQLKELRKIVLSNNQINRVHDKAFSNLHQVNHIDISRNRLTSISRRVFRTVDNTLNTLDLSYNAIQKLPDELFLSLNGLKEVKLGHNLLVTLPSTTWSRIPALLEKADLTGNFLICNCSMDWMPRRMRQASKLVGQCVAPKTVEFQDIKPNLATIASCD